MRRHSSSNAFSCSLLLWFLGIFILFPSSFDAKAADSGHKQADKVIKLPGQPPNVTFDQYSGYVTVDPVAGRALFYWLMGSPASKKPELRPLVLWLADGPGVSSVAFGAWLEIGPFRVGPDGKKLVMNPFSWNQEANLLFLDSSAGVGFSYSNTSSDIITGDTRTANDTFRFLDIWFERFPEYKHRQFYIGGEGYAGHHVPQVAKIIISHNKGIKNPIINFKGILVGNPLIDSYYDSVGAFQFWWNQGLISDSTYESLNVSCPRDSYLFPRTPCYLALKRAYSEFGDINPFSLNSNNVPCKNSPGKSSNSTEMLLPFKFRANNPCIVQYTTAYMNMPEVQKALHANLARITQPWSMGSEAIRGAWTDSPKSVLPIFKELIAAKLRIWVYSGDADVILPLTSTRTTLKALKLQNLTSWYAWIDNKMVAGWSQVYEGLTYVTVRGAGHQVPLTRPKLALNLIRHFLHDKPMPSS